MLCPVLNDGYANYVYYKKHGSSFPGQCSNIPIKKNDVQNLFQRTQKGIGLFCHKFNPRSEDVV